MMKQKNRTFALGVCLCVMFIACNNSSSTTGVTDEPGGDPGNGVTDEPGDDFRLPGATLSAPTASFVTYNSITVNALTASTGQTVDYAISQTTAAPDGGWTEERTFDGLQPETDYYVFARARETLSHERGEAARSAAIRTLAVPASMGAVESGIYRNLFLEMGKSDAEINAKVEAAWNRLFYGAADQKIYYEVGTDMAYILDTGNNDVRSEGMSYGMMIAVQLDKKEEFDRLWRWSRAYMYNDRNTKTDDVRGYFSWQCNTDGSKKDRNTAPDGEFYFVTALLFAETRWGNGTGITHYGLEARNILYDMIHRDPGGLDNWGAPAMFNPTHKMPVFSTIGNAANHTDPSYHLPAFFEIWAMELEEDVKRGDVRGPWASLSEKQASANFYKEAAQVSRDFFPITTHPATGLGPDYANFDGTPTGGQHADFRYDAWRIAMNIGMDYAWFKKDPWQIIFADRIQSFFHSKGVTAYGHLWTLDGNLLSDNDAGAHSPGLVACNSVASLAAAHERAREFLDDFWNIGMTSGTYRYYDGCLYMLGLLHASGNFKAYLSEMTPSEIGAVITPATAEFDKNESGEHNKDIVFVITPNEWQFTGIRNGSAPLSTPGDYTVTANEVTLKKAYLAGLGNGTATLAFEFGEGKSVNVLVTIGDSAAGPIGEITKITFENDVNVTLSTANQFSVSQVKGGAAENSYLRVEKTSGYSSPEFIIPFDLGTKTIADFSAVVVEIRGESGDFTGGKTFTVRINNASILSSSGQNMNSIGATSWTSLNLGINSAAASSSGQVQIAFGINNTNPVVYHVRSIELIPKP